MLDIKGEANMSIKIGVILASIREGRNGEAVANWVLEQANLRSDKDVSYRLIDLKTYDLPFLGKMPTESQAAAIDAWSNDMASYDGYILVTPEYNHVVPGTLQNAFQFLKPEVANKALAFVGYGFLGAARAIVGFRAHLVYQQVAIVQQQINLSFNVDYKDFGTDKAAFTPGAWHLPEVKTMIDQLIGWSKALKALRNGDIK